MSPFHGWGDWQWYLDRLRGRAGALLADTRFRARFDPSDLVDETVARALAACDSAPCRGTTPAERLGWLLAHMDHEVIDQYRHHTAEKRDIDREQDARALAQALDESSADVLAAAAAGGPTPASEAADRIDLAEALARLPEPHRSVMRLYLNKRTRRQIADALSLAPGQVAGYVARGTEMLRDELNPSGGESDAR